MSAAAISEAVRASRPSAFASILLQIENDTTIRTGLRLRDLADVLGNLVAFLHGRPRGDREIPALHVRILVHVYRLPLETRNPRPDRDVGDRVVVRHVLMLGEA